MVVAVVSVRAKFGSFQKEATAAYFSVTKVPARGQTSAVCGLSGLCRMT